MVVDPSPILACAAVWRPSKGWAGWIREAIEALEAGATGLEASAAWRMLAMMAGDTRGAPLALIACLHAEASLPDGVVDAQIAPHRDLCLMDLGLAAPARPGPIPIVDLGKPETTQMAPGQLDAWLARALVPFAGDLARAALFVRRLAAVRTGLADGPDPEP
jgi:hypothetical protein